MSLIISRRQAAISNGLTTLIKSKNKIPKQNQIHVRMMQGNGEQLHQPLEQANLKCATLGFSLL